MASVVFPIQALQMGSLEVRGADPAQMHQPETHPEDVLTSEEKMAGERPQNIMILMNCKKNCKQVLSVDLPRAANTFTSGDHLCCPSNNI